MGKRIMESLSYDDVTLIPQYTTLRSRSDANTNVNYPSKTIPEVYGERCGLLRHNPLISANMESVTGPDMAIKMWELGGIGALHRFQSIEQNVIDYVRVKNGAKADCFVSVGVNGNSRERAGHLFNAGARMFIVDIAHGHSIMMKEMVEWLKEQYGEEITIMGGNVATKQAVRDLAEWGCDIVKCGVGGGSVCTTRRVTGHGVPMFSSVLHCAHEAQECGIKLVADGGIRCSGDIVKALAAGADFVMIGSLLAGTEETPGNVQFDGFPSLNKAYKTYMGSASYEKTGVTKEGIVIKVPYKGLAKDVVEDLVGGLRSGMSYSDAKTIPELITATWVTQSHSGIIEGHPHGKL
jgi:IMP dehydrogenase